MLLAIWSTVSTPTLPVITGSMAATELPDHFVGTSPGITIGSMAVVEAHDAAAFAGEQSTSGTMAAVESADRFAGSQQPQLVWVTSFTTQMAPAIVFVGQ